MAMSQGYAVVIRKGMAVQVNIISEWLEEKNERNESGSCFFFHKGIVALWSLTSMRELQIWPL